MSRITPFKLNTIEGIARGEKATVRLQNGPTYQELVFESNLPPAQISKFTVDIGGVYQIGEILSVTLLSCLCGSEHEYNPQKKSYNIHLASLWCFYQWF